MRDTSVGTLCTMFCKLSATFLALGILFSPAAEAGGASKKPKATDVVAHTVIPGGPVTRMLLVKGGGKRFLLLGFSSPASVEVLDVTDSSQPQALDVRSGGSSTSAKYIELVAETLSAFGEASAGSSGTTGAEPEEIQRFSGVKAFVVDKERQLIYVTNDEGLWIVKTKRKQRFDDDEAKAAEFYGGGG